MSWLYYPTLFRDLRWTPIGWSRRSLFVNFPMPVSLFYLVSIHIFATLCLKIAEHLWSSKLKTPKLTCGWVMHDPSVPPVQYSTNHPSMINRETSHENRPSAGCSWMFMFFREWCPHELLHQILSIPSETDCLFFHVYPTIECTRCLQRLIQNFGRKGVVHS